MPLQKTFRPSYRSCHATGPGERHVLCWVLLYLSLIASFPAWALSTAQEITQEATAPNSETYHPLPLMGSWSAGTQWDEAGSNLGYTPNWQMQMITQGHHLLPWFNMPFPAENPSSSDWSVWLTAYQTAIQNAAALNRPISFVGTQWEQDLYTNPQFLTLPPAQNPNVITPGVLPGTTLGAAFIANGGTGYHVGDVLTVIGGTYTVAAQITVTSANSTVGNIYYVSVTNPGSYTVLPTNPVSTNGGSGTGATFNVYDGVIKPIISPFGATAPWSSVGTTWGSSPLIQQLQAWYPNPPLVIFISNNEGSKLTWSNPEQDQHYLALYGTGQTDEFKREKVAQGWIDRYRPLQQAWRGALTSASWNSNSKFV